MNGHLDMAEERGLKMGQINDEESGHQWKDIHQDLITWSADLEDGELLSIPNFSLYDAMSAIELMDKKMDIGLLLKDRKIKSFQEGVASGLVKMSGFSAVEYLAIVDKSLANLILWIQGHCLAQTVFTLLYLHQPENLEDDLVRSFCWSLMSVTDHIRQIMLDGGVIEEEDFQVSSMVPCPSSDLCPSAGVLVKSLKASEETCYKNSRRHRSSFKDNCQQSDEDESNQWNALGLRFKFLRTLLHFFTSFANRSELFFAEAPQNLDILLATIDKILTGYKLSDDEFNAAPGFEALINLHLLPPSFPRHTPISLDSGTFLFFQKLACQLRLVVPLRERLKTMEGVMFYLRTNSSTVDLALSRSVMEIVISLSLDLKRSSGDEGKAWILSSCHDFITDSLRVFSNPPVIMPAFAQYESHGQMKDYIETFIRSCSALSASLLRMQGLNRARHRDALAVCLVDLFSLQDDAEKLDEYFNTQLAELKLTGLNHTFCLGSWTLTRMLESMTDYLLAGLELQLYGTTELHFIYWYLYDVLLHCQVQTIIRADSAARENELAWNQLQEVELKGSKRNTSKKKANGHNKVAPEPPISRPHMIYLGHAQTLHHLCGAFHFALLALQWEEKIGMPQQSLDCEEFRYYHRLMPFMERNAPAFVDYQHYQVVKSLMGRTNQSVGQESIRDAYFKSSYNFQQADRALSSWPVPLERAALSKLCKRNDVIVRILATGRTCKSVEMKFDLHHWFPSLSIL